MVKAPRALVIREGRHKAGEGDRKHALVVASASPRRNDLVQALGAAGFSVVVEGRLERPSNCAGDPLFDLVVLDLSLAGRQALAALGPEDAAPSEGPRIVLLTGENEIDHLLEDALHGARSGNGSRVRRSGDPARYVALVEEARARILARDLPAALNRLEEAVDEDDQRPEAFNLLGVIEALRQEPTGAQVHWRVALVLAPTYEPARENLRCLALPPRLRGALALG